MNIKSRKTKWIFSILASVLTVMILLYFIIIPKPVKVEIVPVFSGVFRETIQADGIIRSKDRYTVTAFAEGDIKRIALKVGDLVVKDQKITELFWDIKYDPIRSPFEGVISKVYRESAGPVHRGDPLVEIIDPTQIEVMVEMLTTDAVRLEKGMDLKIITGISATPTLLGKVTRISKAGFTKLSALGVEEERAEVTGELVNIPKNFLARMGSNYHVDVTFQISEIPGALMIPAGALFRDGADWAAFSVKDSQAHKVRVSITAINSETALVESGLKLGDLVIVYPGDLVKDGTRIVR